MTVFELLWPVLVGVVVLAVAEHWRRRDRAERDSHRAMLGKLLSTDRNLRHEEARATERVLEEKLRRLEELTTRPRRIDLRVRLSAKADEAVHGWIDHYHQIPGAKETTEVFRPPTPEEEVREQSLKAALEVGVEQLREHYAAAGIVVSDDQIRAEAKAALDGVTAAQIGRLLFQE